MRPGVVLFFLLILTCLSACAPGTGLLGGGTWQSSGLAHQHIRIVVVDQKNPQHLYAGDTQGNVYVSTDAAQHWVQRAASLPGSISALLFDTAGKKLYAATDKGIFASSDAAQHWNRIGLTGARLPPDNYTALATDLHTPQVIYAGTAHHGVYLSVDGGTSWTAINTGLFQDAVINNLTFDSDQHTLWAATSTGVYRYTPPSWHTMNTGLPANSVVNAVAVASTSGGVKGLLYAGTNRGFFLSHDAGASWITSQEALVGTSIHAILVDFRSTNATTVYAGTDIGVLRSDDSGQSWNVVASGMPRRTSVYALALGGNNYTQLYAATGDVYLFPGSSGGISLIRLLPLVIFAFLFYLLYRFTLRTRRPRRNLPPSERNISSPASGNTPISKE